VKDITLQEAIDSLKSACHPLDVSMYALNVVVAAAEKEIEDGPKAEKWAAVNKYINTSDIYEGISTHFESEYFINEWENIVEKALQVSTKENEPHPCNVCSETGIMTGRHIKNGEPIMEPCPYCDAVQRKAKEGNIMNEMTLYEAIERVVNRIKDFASVHPAYKDTDEIALEIVVRSATRTPDLLCCGRENSRIQRISEKAHGGLEK
jgi:hypothetical protein